LSFAFVVVAVTACTAVVVVVRSGGLHDGRERELVLRWGWLAAEQRSLEAELSS